MNGLQLSLTVVVCEDAKEAIEKGFNYSQSAEVYKPVEIQKVVVVRNGTQGSNSTVDFVMKDPEGNNLVFMITANLLRSILATAKDSA